MGTSPRSLSVSPALTGKRQLLPPAPSVSGRLILMTLYNCYNTTWWSWKEVGASWWRLEYNPCVASVLRNGGLCSIQRNVSFYFSGIFGFECLTDFGCPPGERCCSRRCVEAFFSPTGKCPPFHYLLSFYFLPVGMHLSVRKMNARPAEVWVTPVPAEFG